MKQSTVTARLGLRFSCSGLRVYCSGKSLSPNLIHIFLYAPSWPKPFVLCPNQSLHPDPVNPKELNYISAHGQCKSHPAHQILAFDPCRVNPQTQDPPNKHKYQTYTSTPDNPRSLEVTCGPHLASTACGSLQPRLVPGSLHWAACF